LWSTSVKNPLAVFFNDAGGGKDDAGKVGLGMLQAIGVPAACYSHMSARIGDAQDGLENGILTDMNDFSKASRHEGGFAGFRSYSLRIKKVNILTKFTFTES